MSPLPAKWKGKCEFDFMVGNNKLIGARDFSIGNGILLDEFCYGTHNASIVVGNFVPGANLFDNANGTAARITSLAHLAMYKINAGSYSKNDIVAAMEAVVYDVIYLSGSCLGIGFFDNDIVIETSIFMSTTIKNYGPEFYTIQNGALWILTMGANTIDRKIRATVVLGNNEEVDEESTFQSMNFTPIQLFLV